PQTQRKNSPGQGNFVNHAIDRFELLHIAFACGWRISSLSICSGLFLAYVYGQSEHICLKIESFEAKFRVGLRCSDTAAPTEGSRRAVDHRIDWCPDCPIVYSVVLPRRISSTAVGVADERQSQRLPCQFGACASSTGRPAPYPGKAHNC